MRLSHFDVEQPGSVHRLTFDSAILKSNALQDPSERDLFVYTPPGYDESESYPLFMVLAGYTGSGQSHVAWRAFGMNCPQRIDYLINKGDIGPVIAVFPDCFTAYGGNQYINSSATGRYMDYLIEEVIPLTQKHFSVHKNPQARAVLGKSSGGYGAMMHGLLKAEYWGAIACHSGDAYFEYAYLADMPDFLSEIMHHNGSVTQFLHSIWQKEKLKSSEAMALMMIGMAAHYDPDPDTELGFHLPVDLHTGEINWQRWQQWLAHDPVRLITEYADNLRQLRGLYIDCGTKDQFKLLWGARMLHEKLDACAIPHDYHEFDDNHSDINYRMNTSLPYLYRCVKGAMTK